MITTLQLIRHGETDWNREGRYQGLTDIPLNETGQRQASELAAAMADERWDVFATSPLIRCVQTATAVATAEGVPLDQLIEDARLVERDQGIAEGMLIADRLREIPGDTWEGLESPDAAADRGLAALHDLIATHAGKRILVFTHGGIINAMLTRISGGEIGTGKTPIRNTGRTDLSYDGGHWTWGRVSDIAHLSQPPL